MRQAPDRLNITSESELALPSRESEKKIALRHAEWTRLRKRVGKLKDPLAGASSWSATFLGIAVGAGLALIPVVGATEEKDSWVVPVMIATTVFASIFSISSYWVHRKMKAGGSAAGLVDIL